MFNDFLLCFFFGMPAIVGVATANEMNTPLLRRVMVWGGLFAIGIIAIVGIPMLACDGHLMKPHTSCFGGTSVTTLANTLNPAAKVGAMAYILLLFPLGVFLHALDRFLLQRRSKA